MCSWMKRREDPGRKSQGASTESRGAGGTRGIKTVVSEKYSPLTALETYLLFTLLFPSAKWVLCHYLFRKTKLSFWVKCQCKIMLAKLVRKP